MVDDKKLSALSLVTDYQLAQLKPGHVSASPMTESGYSGTARRLIVVVRWSSDGQCVTYWLPTLPPGGGCGRTEQARSVVLAVSLPALPTLHCPPCPAGGPQPLLGTDQ